LLERYFIPPEEIEVAEDVELKPKERNVHQKLLRRLLDMGAGPAEARLIFQRLLAREDEPPASASAGQRLNTDTLELIRSAMKSRWLPHISFEGPQASLVVSPGTNGGNSSGRGIGLPAGGFTFMVCIEPVISQILTVP
jgi:hypothetical protein